MDHYLDVPVDVSKVLFICMANLIGTPLPSFPPSPPPSLPRS